MLRTHTLLSRADGDRIGFPARGLYNAPNLDLRSRLLTAFTQVSPEIDLDTANRELAAMEAWDIVKWAAGHFGKGLIVTSSFGAESALMLHLATRVVPDIPVVCVDTGYMFPETYRFMEELRQRFNLNLHVYQADISPARMEATMGRVWEDGVEGLDRYDQLRKVEPMNRALRDLGATAWLSGVRADQTDHRKTLRPIEPSRGGVYKIHPILKWTAREIEAYFTIHDLPYHPLVEQGYRSIGDTHTTTPVADGQDARAGRFGGLKQECGLHLPATQQENESRGGSSL
jgi:phosphoadenosine phosphosulfate reductase